MGRHGTSWRQLVKAPARPAWCDSHCWGARSILKTVAWHPADLHCALLLGDSIQDAGQECSIIQGQTVSEQCSNAALVLDRLACVQVPHRVSTLSPPALQQPVSGRPSAPLSSSPAQTEQLPIAHELVKGTLVRCQKLPATEKLTHGSCVTSDRACCTPAHTCLPEAHKDLVSL